MVGGGRLEDLEASWARFERAETLSMWWRWVHGERPSCARMQPLVFDCSGASVSRIPRHQRVEAVGPGGPL